MWVKMFLVVYGTSRTILCDSNMINLKPKQELGIAMVEIAALPTSFHEHIVGLKRQGLNVPIHQLGNNKVYC